MFWSRRYTPVNHSFTVYIIVGCKGVFVTRTCFRDVWVWESRPGPTQTHDFFCIIRKQIKGASNLYYPPLKTFCLLLFIYFEPILDLCWSVNRLHLNVLYCSIFPLELIVKDKRSVFFHFLRRYLLMHK